MKNSVGPLSVALLLLGGCYQSPKTASPTAALPSSTAPKQEQSISACDDWMGPATKDVQIVSLFNRLQSLGLKKGEYETTAAFEERAAAEINKAQGALVDVAGTRRVVVTTPLAATYDADRSRLKVLVSFHSLGRRQPIVIDGSKLDQYQLIPVTLNQGVTGSYTGSNAFGATREVTKISGQEYGVALTDIRSLYGSWLFVDDFKGLELVVSPDRAKAMKAKVGLRVIGELTAPGALQGTSHERDPTINSPIDMKTMMHYVTIKSTCAAVVALDNGEILQRLK